MVVNVQFHRTTPIAAFDCACCDRPRQTWHPARDCLPRRHRALSNYRHCVFGRMDWSRPTSSRLSLVDARTTLHYGGTRTWRSCQSSYRRTYSSGAGITDHRCGHSVGRKYHSFRVNSQFSRAWNSPSNAELGKHAHQCSRVDLGSAKPGFLPGVDDLRYSYLFQLSR